jgi:thiol-disulfide isomerase/thioredoxin
MNKKILKTASVVALAATLTACGKTKTVEKKVEWTEEEKIQWAEENGYVQAEVEDTRAELEVAMGTTMSAIDAPYLKNYIGSVGASGETFGEKKDMLVFYGINECGTCEAIKPIVNAYVASSGHKVYYYNPDNSTALAAIKAEVLKKLGSTDGVTLTGPMLIAYVDGEYKGALSGTEITAESIATFVGTYYRDDLGAKTVANSWEFENLAQLRTKIAEGKKFVLYATRFNCPWCRKLADTARDNALNKLLRSYEGNLATITSEKVMDEYNSIYVKGTIDTLEIVEPTAEGAMTAWQWLYAQDNGATPDVVNETNIPAYWPNTKTAVQKAEVLLYLVATGEVGAHVTGGQITNADQVAFLKEVAAYAAKQVGTGEGQVAKKFVATDRNIPAFIAVGFTKAEEEANTVAKDAIISRRSSMVNVDFETGEITISGANANRALFPEYFTGATSGKTQIDYVTPAEEVTAAYYYLTMWVNSWTYEA